MERSPQLAVRYRFGATEVNPGHRELLHDGMRVGVGDRAFDLLLLLIEQRGAVVSKDRIMEVVWPKRIIGENTLEAQVSLLRRALHRDRDTIRTIAGRGYQFTGDLSIDTSAGSHAANADATTTSRAPELRARDLPAYVSRLVGRESQLSEVAGLALSRRCVTLVGAGGVGKTRLAIEAARQLKVNFPDGCVLIELAATSSAEYVPATVATAFGFPPGDGTLDLEKLAPSLRDRQLLIVVDNCEHLIESAAHLVERLMQVSPGSTVIATSREALRIGGEQVYGVPSLDMPQEDDEHDAERYGAIALFLERIGVGADERADACLPFVVRICRQLDGIPLAIELAAACTAAFGVQGVADLLDDRFQMLRGGSRTALPRQQTLRATVDWSYALLPAALRTVLLRLSLFAGTFTLDSAQRMLAGADMSREEVTTAIGELVDKSLLCAVPSLPQMNYRMLNTIRAFARERLDESGTSDEWLARHAGHILGIFRTAEKFAEARAEIDWNRTFGLYLDDLRAAIDWGFSSQGQTAIAIELVVASIAPSMQFSLIEECLRRIDAALEALSAISPDSSPPLPMTDWEMKLHAARGACLLFQSVGAQTSEAFAVALALAEKAENIEYQLRGLWGCWSHAYLNGKHAEALALASRFANIATRSRWAADRMVAGRMSGISHLCLGQLHEALDELQRIHVPDSRANRAERIRFLYDERSMTHAVLAQALALLGRHDEAAVAAQQALEDAHALDHAASTCYALSEALCPTALLHDDGRLEPAVQALIRATRRHGVSTWKARAEMWNGLLALRAGQVESYDASITPSLDEIGGAKYHVVLAAFLSETAIALANLGRTREAAALLDRAIARATAIKDIFSWSELLRAKVDVMLMQPEAGAVRRAEPALIHVLRIARQHGFVEWEARCRRSLARLSAITGKSPALPE
jgi:predicted ATPase/DNA-binding winged helix-turn-helix (wHTH) protein